MGKMGRIMARQAWQAGRGMARPGGTRLGMAGMVIEQLRLDFDGATYVPEFDQERLGE